MRCVSGRRREATNFFGGARSRSPGPRLSFGKRPRAVIVFTDVTAIRFTTHRVPSQCRVARPARTAAASHTPQTAGIHTHGTVGTPDPQPHADRMTSLRHPTQPSTEPVSAMRRGARHVIQYTIYFIPGYTVMLQLSELPLLGLARGHTQLTSGEGALARSCDMCRAHAARLPAPCPRCVRARALLPASFAGRRAPVAP